jgi:hypothetical protein
LLEENLFAFSNIKETYPYQFQGVFLELHKVKDSDAQAHKLYYGLPFLLCFQFM